MIKLYFTQQSDACRRPLASALQSYYRQQKKNFAYVWSAFVQRSVGTYRMQYFAPAADDTSRADDECPKCLANGHLGVTFLNLTSGSIAPNRVSQLATWPPRGAPLLQAGLASVNMSGCVCGGVVGANGEESLWSPVELLNIASVIDGKLGIFVKQTATVFFSSVADVREEKEKEKEKEKACCCSHNTTLWGGQGRLG
ncbi:hypothetical protein C0Q70_15567 [Pomacea canaliculata]|uniref:Uncharacterized protein n=1 Tax=Pomacea canaliculata TaxID=400727 RepID=A0A2T7NV68_POMCA|nr:hypothetical protein C0Q70_15567 [Pomacea canaliculata]